MEDITLRLMGTLVVTLRGEAVRVGRAVAATGAGAS